MRGGPLRGRGVTYDTGACPAGRITREEFEPAAVGREMRITGQDPERLGLAAEFAADAGLRVWFSPFPSEMTTERLLPYLADCAARAEELRRHGAEVTAARRTGADAAG